MTHQSHVELSICIPTFNRAAFIGVTLDSIISQATSECEIVVSDNASTDDTEQIVSKYAQRFDRLRYFRQETNTGFDRNYDSAVELSRGRYCWLMTDDDILNPGAIAAVLEAIRRNPGLILVNVEYRDFCMSKVLQPSGLPYDTDRAYRPVEMERLFVEAHLILKYVGCFVVNRKIWLARNRERYYNSGFIFLGVIFQEQLPEEALVIAKPLIRYRRGAAHTYSPQLSEVIYAKMPSVIESLTTVSESARSEFWQVGLRGSFQELLHMRAWGVYSLTEYRRWVRPRLRSTRKALTSAFVAFLPGTLVNTLFMLYFALTRQSQGVWSPDMELQSLRESRFYYRNWRVFNRAS
jgi:abequosyltransferase